MVTATEGQYVYCGECRTPVGQVQNGQLIIKSHHHGRLHVTILELKSIDMKAGNVVDVK